MVEEVNAALIVIGNEVLSGRTQDANIRYLALGLDDVGIRLREVRIIADDESAIIKAVNELRAVYSYVFTTGGIGPTHDDITSDAVAKAFGVPLRRNPDALARLQSRMRPEDLNEARLRMANIPEGASLIGNPISQAPGFRLGNVLVLAGVPRIMQAMFEGIKSSLAGGARILSRSVTLHAPEGAVATALAGLQARRPETEIGSYPFSRNGAFGTVVVVRGTDESIVLATAAEVVTLADAEGIRAVEEQPVS